MSEQLELLKSVTQRLERSGIAYMLTGSVAVSYYAEPRFTRDIDLVVEIPLEAADAQFDSDFYADVDALRAAIRRYGMINLIHTSTLIKIDLILRKESAYHIEEFARRRQAVIDEGTMWIVTPEDLILSKLSWLKQGGSDVHRLDIFNLLRAVTTIDHGYIDRWSGELGVSSLWKDVSAS